MGLIIRKMTLEDIDAVCIMEEETFSMPWHRESFLEMISNRDALYLVAEICGSDKCKMTEPDDVVWKSPDLAPDYDGDVIVCGCAGVISVLGEGDICNIVVKEGFRRLGIAERLVRSMILLGHDEYGIEEFTLEVRKSNDAAISLYEGLGFVREGVRPGFYDKPKEDAYIYWLRSTDGVTE